MCRREDTSAYSTIFCVVPFVAGAMLLAMFSWKMENASVESMVSMREGRMEKG